jgi:hypothetical protein
MLTNAWLHRVSTHVSMSRATITVSASLGTHWMKMEFLAMVSFSCQTFFPSSNCASYVNSDVDECLVANGGCGHHCTNTEGSFDCSCQTGFSLGPSNLDCHGELTCKRYECLHPASFHFADVDECLSSNGGCAHTCTNTEGGYECSCRSGYLLGEENRTCVDVNECSDSPCNHTCVNIPGGFHCECEEGYDLDGDGVSCTGMRPQSIAAPVKPYMSYRY